MDMLFTTFLQIADDPLTEFPFTIHISPNVISQQVFLGETVLLDVERLVYFGLDEFGSRLWQELQDTPDANQVFSRLRPSSDLSATDLQGKIMEIINGLERSRIIKLEPRADAVENPGP